MLKNLRNKFIESTHALSKFFSLRTTLAVDHYKEIASQRTFYQFIYSVFISSKLNFTMLKNRLCKLYYPISSALMSIHFIFAPTLNLPFLVVTENYTFKIKKDLLIIFILHVTISNDLLLHFYFYLLIFIKSAKWWEWQIYECWMVQRRY